MLEEGWLHDVIVDQHGRSVSVYMLTLACQAHALMADTPALVSLFLQTCASCYHLNLDRIPNRSRTGSATNELSICAEVGPEMSARVYRRAV